MLDKIKKLFNNKEAQAKKHIEAKSKKAEDEAKKTPKDLATERGEPWVEVLSMEIDKDNPGQGSFELDWND